MAQSNVTVSSTATVLAAAANPSAANYTVTIVSPPGSAVCYVGQSGVTTSTGTEFHGGSTMTVLALSAGIYAVCASNTQATLSVAVNTS